MNKPFQQGLNVLDYIYKRPQLFFKENYKGTSYGHIRQIIVVALMEKVVQHKCKLNGVSGIA